HMAGLGAAGVHESPSPYAALVTSTTQTTLRGPRGGLNLSNAAANEKFNFNRAVFPVSQCGPLQHIIAAKAIAFKKELEP
ncbi:serine hydroxymethyltransferase, partial [Parvimonas micra]|nr:serine hydroxymethyltransferase [Parvimonas micra]